MSLFTKEVTREKRNPNGGVTMEVKKTVRVVPVVLTALVIVLILSLGISCTTVIEAGHTGVVSTFGKVSEDVLQEGFHFKAPWQKVTMMDNRIVKLEVMTEAFSSDLQTVSVNLAVNYRVDTSMSYSIVKNIGTGYESVLITPAVNEVMKSIMASYTAEASIASRNAVSTALVEQLNDKLSGSGIHITDINIIDFDFSEAYIAAIEAKQVEAQKKLQAEIEQERLTMEREAEAKRQVIAAESAAEVAKIEADASKYAAEREAEANQKISESLTDMFIEYTKAQNWNGELPTVMGSDTIIGYGEISPDTPDTPVTPAPTTPAD